MPRFSLESRSRSNNRNLDMPSDPEGIYQQPNKSKEDGWSTIENMGDMDEYRKSIRRLNSLMDSLGPAMTAAEAEEQHKQKVADARDNVQAVFDKMDQVSSFGKQAREASRQNTIRAIHNSLDKDDSFDMANLGQKSNNDHDDDKLSLSDISSTF